MRYRKIKSTRKAFESTRRVTLIKISTKRSKELENMRAIAKERGISEEDAVFSLMRDVPAMFAIMQDWDDMRTISTAVIRELKSYMSFRNIYVFVMRVVNLYDDTGHQRSVYS